MSEYVGEIGKRINARVTFAREYCYTTTFGWSTQDNYIYTFEDSAGNVYVWKTTALVGMDREDADGTIWWDGARKGDTLTVRGTVKEHAEYKGVKQTVLSRVKVTEIVHATTREELDAEKQREQIDSLCDGDVIWRMPYRQYKDHYADCEVVAGSYDRDERTIKVIVRAGRLVPSGVRGRHFRRFIFADADGVRYGFRAVSEENAYRQFRKDYPNVAGAECVKILD